MPSSSEAAKVSRARSQARICPLFIQTNRIINPQRWYPKLARRVIWLCNNLVNFLELNGSERSACASATESYRMSCKRAVDQSCARKSRPNFAPSQNRIRQPAFHVRGRGTSDRAPYKSFDLYRLRSDVGGTFYRRRQEIRSSSIKDGNLQRGSTGFSFGPQRTLFRL
jgi:hypothetical protein